jgi:hypothetical protein
MQPLTSSEHGLAKLRNFIFSADQVAAKSICKLFYSNRAKCQSGWPLVANGYQHSSLVNTPSFNITAYPLCIHISTSTHSQREAAAIFKSHFSMN